MLDGETVVKIEHLEASLALWAYGVDSALYVFGDAGAFSSLARKIELDLLAAGRAGRTRAELRRVTGNDVPADKITQALDELREAGRARLTKERVAGGTKPTHRWHHTRFLLGQTVLRRAPTPASLALACEANDATDVGGIGENGDISVFSNTSAVAESPSPTPARDISAISKISAGSTAHEDPTPAESEASSLQSFILREEHPRDCVGAGGLVERTATRQPVADDDFIHLEIG